MAKAAYIRFMIWLAMRIQPLGMDIEFSWPTEERTEGDWVVRKRVRNAWPRFKLVRV